MTKQEQKQQREYILELIRNGMAPKDIVDQVGCGLSSVYVIANRNGITINQNNRVMKKNLPDALVDAMRFDAASGMTKIEIGNKYNIPASAAKEICNGYFVKKNQWGVHGTLDERRVANTIAERLPRWEYAGNYTGTDGECDIRCKTCGTVKHIKSQAIRHRSARCSVCFERERAEREERRKIEREAERQIREAQRQKELEIQRQEAILRRKEREKRERLEHTAVFTCEGCGSMFLADDRRLNKYCSDKCKTRAYNKRKDISRRIKIKQQMVDSDISLERLYQRDGGICYLCGRVCDWNDREVVDGTIICGDTYPSIEHIIPLSKNGKHAWVNVKLACRRCNSFKSDKLIELNEKTHEAAETIPLGVYRGCQK